MSELSNAMADRAEQVKADVKAWADADRAGIEHALAAGRALAEARAETTHGAWTVFLERAGVHERQARRLMQLARAGLKTDTVSDLGGVKAALAWLAGRKLPGEDEGLWVTLDEDPASQPYAVVSRWRGGFRVICITPEHELIEITKPVVGPSESVWMVVGSLLRASPAKMTFQVRPDHRAWESEMGLAA